MLGYYREFYETIRQREIERQIFEEALTDIIYNPQGVGEGWNKLRAIEAIQKANELRNPQAEPANLSPHMRI